MMQSQALVLGNSVVVHAGRGKKEKACMCNVTSRNLEPHHAANFIEGDSV